MSSSWSSLVNKFGNNAERAHLVKHDVGASRVDMPLESKRGPAGVILSYIWMHFSVFRTISVERRDGDLDNILSELKSKGSRMRFGKRSPKQDKVDLDNYYFPDRYIYLQWLLMQIVT